MIQNTTGDQKDEKHRSTKDLLIWLVLIPLTLGTLLCCGQLALFLLPGESGRNTNSLLSADYRPWEYGNIAPININEEAFMNDIEEEKGTVVVGEFWVPPTPTAVSIAQATGTPTPRIPGASNTPGTPKTRTPTPTGSGNVTPTYGPTSTRVPSATPLPIVTNTTTPTLPAPPLPPRPPTATNAPARPTNTRTNTPVPSSTPTNTPTPPPPPLPPPPPPPTWTPTVYTATPATTTPSPTPTYAPVRPIAQNNGASEQVANGGCRIFFDYQNDNPNEVDIPIGPRNNLNDPAAVANPPQPTHFLVGRVIGAFEFTWYSGQPLIWTLDGRTATAYWCY